METREKQAYMLMAHQCNEMFWTLLRMLDAPWNDIFIHMDSKNENYQPETVERYVKYAKVFHAQRTSAVWGGITLVKAEFVLLKAAVDHGPYPTLPPDLRCGSADSATGRYPRIL